eukprot:SM000153S01598  [mRNA]  locus=s153:173248:175860:- [translate_table: standard]
MGCVQARSLEASSQVNGYASSPEKPAVGAGGGEAAKAGGGGGEGVHVVSLMSSTLGSLHVDYGDLDRAEEDAAAAAAAAAAEDDPVEAEIAAMKSQHLDPSQKWTGDSIDLSELESEGGAGGAPGSRQSIARARLHGAGLVEDGDDLGAWPEGDTTEEEEAAIDVGELMAGLDEEDDLVEGDRNAEVATGESSLAVKPLEGDAAEHVNLDACDHDDDDDESGSSKEAYLHRESIAAGFSGRPFRPPPILRIPSLVKEEVAADGGRGTALADKQLPGHPAELDRAPLASVADAGASPKPPADSNGVVDGASPEPGSPIFDLAVLIDVEHPAPAGTPGRRQSLDSQSWTPQKSPVSSGGGGAGSRGRLSFDGRRQLSPIALASGHNPGAVGTPNGDAAPARLSLSPDGSLFDPDLLASMEAAFHDSNKDNWHGAAAAGEPQPATIRAESKEAPAAAAHLLPPLQLPLSGEDAGHSALLAGFPAICPPRGMDGAVLYTTSLRGIFCTSSWPHTDEATAGGGSRARALLEALGVAVDERDVSLHLEYRDELRALLGPTVAPVPHLFVRGFHIGGAADIERLHEGQALVPLLQGLPQLEGKCMMCNGMRFVPCHACNGSRKLSDKGGAVLACSYCNENGLMRCPLCLPSP